MGNSPRTTCLLIVLLIIAAIIMFCFDAATLSETKSDLIQFCHSDGRCTRASGAFWAEVDSVDAARFFAGGDDG